MHKLLITNTSEEFCGAVAELLSEYFDIRLCCEGNRALELIKSFRPDIVCLDMMLPGLDGLSILEETISSGLNPVALVIVDCVSEYVINSLNRMGIGFMMRKPCAPSAVAGRLIDMKEQNCCVFNNPLTAKDPMETILASLGFRTTAKNYVCVIEALRTYMKDSGQAITKILYPAVASRCGGSAPRIEKSIRDAIHYAWQYRDNVFWKRFFPRACRTEKCPSNGEFIRVVSGLLSAEDLTWMFSTNADLCSDADTIKTRQLEAVVGL